MAIDIEEKFEVQASIDEVWAFVMDPVRVASCMPGAKLEEVVDERNFVGSIRIKIGAISTAYKGKVAMTEVDERARTVVMAAEGTEAGGGTARGTMNSVLRSLPDGRTELVATASVELTGRVMQVGSRMIKGVSHQLFKQFVAKAKKQLESGEATAAGAAATASTTATASPAGQPAAAHSASAPVEPEAISIVSLLFKTFLAAIVNFFRRLFGKPATGK
ncbi:MAG: SRPBCC family protein [Candidatus Binatia bacterium]